MIGQNPIYIISGKGSGVLWNQMHLES
jgi:hypothetical protein